MAENKILYIKAIVQKEAIETIYDNYTFEHRKHL